MQLLHEKILDCKDLGSTELLHEAVPSLKLWFEITNAES